MMDLKDLYSFIGNSCEGTSFCDTYLTQERYDTVYADCLLNSYYPNIRVASYIIGGYLLGKKATYLGNYALSRSCAFIAGTIVKNKGYENWFNETANQSLEKFQKGFLKTAIIGAAFIGFGYFIEEQESLTNIYLQKLASENTVMAHISRGDFSDVTSFISKMATTIAEQVKTLGKKPQDQTIVDLPTDEGPSPFNIITESIEESLDSLSDVYQRYIVGRLRFSNLRSLDFWERYGFTHLRQALSNFFTKNTATDFVQTASDKTQSIWSSIPSYESIKSINVTEVYNHTYENASERFETTKAWASQAFTNFYSAASSRYEKAYNFTINFPKSGEDYLKDRVLEELENTPTFKFYKLCNLIKNRFINKEES